MSNQQPPPPPPSSRGYQQEIVPYIGPQGDNSNPQYHLMSADGTKAYPSSQDEQQSPTGYAAPFSQALGAARGQFTPPPYNEPPQQDLPPGAQEGPGLPATSQEHAPINVLMNPLDATFNQPVEMNGGVTFEDRSALVDVHSGLQIEGSLVVHGSLIVDGQASFGGPQTRFRYMYSAQNGQLIVLREPTGNPFQIQQHWHCLSTQYIFNEGLAAHGQNTVEVFGHLRVRGSLFVEGQAIMNGNVTFRGGSNFRVQPIVQNNQTTTGPSGTQPGQQGSRGQHGRDNRRMGFEGHGGR